MRLVLPSLAALLALASCAEAQQAPTALAPAAAPAAPATSADACIARARALGFIVQRQDPAYRDAYGNIVIPLLVTWGNSAVDVDCHIDRQGGVTVE